MVFSTLSQRDKEAFFALLDEYFEARPGLLGGSKPSAIQSVVASHTGTTSLRSNPSSPPAAPTRSLSTNTNGTSASLKPRAVPPAPVAASSPPVIPSRTATPKIVEQPPQEDDDDIDEAPVSVSSRIAAAQAAIGNGYVTGKQPIPSQRRVSTQSLTSQTSSNAPPPPSRSPAPVPARPAVPTSSSASSNSNAPGGLVSSRGIGSIDTSSGGAAVSSVFSFKGMGKNPPKNTATIPSNPAFEKTRTRDTFAPPPSRAASNPAIAKRAASPPPPPPPQQEEEEEEEEEEAQGEWVEALYDLRAAEPTDLSFKAGDQIWVTERTSKDWWMAEINGQAGLVPATYVKPM